MAKHEATPIERAWTDFEPKFLAWVMAGGLLTVATIVYGYLFPGAPLPEWLQLVIPFVGGLIVSYLKKSSIPVNAVAPATKDDGLV